MSIAEVIYRVKEAKQKRRDRGFVPSGTASEALPFLPGLREALERWQVPEGLIGEWREILTQAKSGRFVLLNMTWPECGNGQRWHLDPVTKRSWPQKTYCFDIDYRHGSGLGDVKYVWELGRLQHLQAIAALAFKTKDADAAKFTLAEIESWINSNPPYKGVHWACGIELALRAVSILTVATLAGEYATQAQRTKILRTLEAHAIWLERYPSLFSSANNHRAAEGLGLFLIGALCPAMPKAEHYRTAGWAILCEMARLLILNDGAGAEQSITYTAFTAEMLLLALRAAHALEIEVPADVTQRLALTGEYLRWFTDANGNQPLIGDDDAGRVIGPGKADEHYAGSVLSAIAATLHRPDLTPPQQKPHLRQAFFGFAPEAADAPTGMHYFAEGGYTVGRHTAEGKDVLLALDHGPLGYLSIAAHGHADALSIWLHLDGAPILVDAGTYLYHAGGEWRRHFRSTKAHNTLCLSGTDSSTMSGNFNWSHKARAQRIACRQSGPDSWYAEAEHDGYAKRFGAIHRRRVAVTQAKGFTVTDSIIATERRQAEISFLLHPSLQAIREGREIHLLKEGKPMLRIAHEGLAENDIHLADSKACGWYSSSFGIRQPTTRIIFSGLLTPEEEAVTRFTYG